MAWSQTLLCMPMYAGMLRIWQCVKRDIGMKGWHHVTLGCVLKQSCPVRREPRLVEHAAPDNTNHLWGGAPAQQLWAAQAWAA